MLTAGGITTRRLEPGERQSCDILDAMGESLEAWLREVGGGGKKMEWIDAVLQRQITLINLIQKDTNLLSILRKDDTFETRSVNIFHKADGQIPVTTGSRQDKLMRVIRFAQAEWKCSLQESTHVRESSEDGDTRRISQGLGHCQSYCGPASPCGQQKQG